MIASAKRSTTTTKTTRLSNLRVHCTCMRVCVCVRDCNCIWTHKHTASHEREPKRTKQQIEKQSLSVADKALFCFLFLFRFLLFLPLSFSHKPQSLPPKSVDVCLFLHKLQVHYSRCCCFSDYYQLKCLVFSNQQHNNNKIKCLDGQTQRLGISSSFSLLVSSTLLASAHCKGERVVQI